MKSFPSITKALSSSLAIIPIYSAMALAVTKLSPVTILTVIPAFLQSLIDSSTYGLGTSLTPIIINKVNPSF